MQQPTEAGQLSQFLMSINWIRDSILNLSATDSFACISDPLWQLLDEIYKIAKSRKKRKYANIPLAPYWQPQHTEAFERLKDKLHTMCCEQSFYIPGARMCLFTDASDHYYAALLTQVPD